MGCICSINACGDDYCSVIKHKKVKSKKVHRCYECYRDIEKGEIYLIETIADDSGLSTHKTCLDCLSIRENLMCDYVFERVLEDVEYAIEDEKVIPEECISRLTPNAREWVCGLIERIWDECDM